MKIGSREFQRGFTRIREAARTGECVHVTSNGQEFLFPRVQSQSWRGALQNGVKIVDDLYSTGLDWESS